MDYYEIVFYTSTAGAVSTLLIFLSSILKFIKKKQKKLAGYFMLYIFFGGFLSSSLYASTAYISWQMPWEVSYQTQCILFALVFCSNIIGIVLLGEFCNYVYYKSNKRFSQIIWFIGIILFSVFLLGGIIGYSHSPMGENNNDIKFEYYILYYLFFLPIISINIYKTYSLIHNFDIEKEYRRLLSFILLFFLGLVILFIFALLDVFWDSIVDNIITMLLIPVCCCFAYIGFFKNEN